jgi:hypothetical protein
VDSAITIFDASGTVSKVYEDADKIFQVGTLPIGVATYGVAALQGRTIGSFIRQFVKDDANADLPGLALKDVVERLRKFIFEEYVKFAEQVHSLPFADISPEQKGVLGLIIGGFSPKSYLSELWEIVIPVHSEKDSSRQRFAAGNFGFAWFAAADPIHRYIKGLDPGLSADLRAYFEKALGRPFSEDELGELQGILNKHEYYIKLGGMPIQSGIACAKFLVELVLGHYRFAETHPIVGGKTKVGVVTYSHDAFRILE